MRQEDKTEELIPVTNIRRYPGAFTSLAFALGCCLLASLPDSDNLPKILLYVGAGIFFVETVLLLQKRKFKIKENHLYFRDGFLWKKWAWENIESVEIKKQRWLGFPTQLITLKLFNNQAIVIDETRTMDRGTEKNESGPTVAEKLEKIRSIKNEDMRKKHE